MTKELKDIFISMVLILLSIFIYVWIIPNYVPDNLTTDMSPRFFPIFGTFLIIGFSFILLITAVYKFKKNTNKRSVKKEKNMLNLMPLVVVIALSLFIVLFQWLGFLTASPITIALLMGIFGQRKPIIILLASIAVTAGMFFVFNYGLNLPLI